MQEKINGEIEVELMEKIIKTLPDLTAIYSKEHTILIHGMGGQTRSFYRELKQNKSVEVLWTGWSSKIWWTYLLSFIPGQSGLTKIIDRKKIDSIYEKIGALTMCGLYFIPNKYVELILNEIKTNRESEQLESILKNENNFFLLTVDFDFHGGEKDGEIFYRGLVLGEKINTEIKETLTLTE